MSPTNCLNDSWFQRSSKWEQAIGPNPSMEEEEEEEEEEEMTTHF
jgi:hypothetical protein